MSNGMQKGAKPPLIDAKLHTVLFAGLTSDQAALDQYKAYVSDVGNIGTRYTTAQGFYWSIVTALIALIAVKGAPVSAAQYLNSATALIWFFLFVVCVIWCLTLLFYQALFRAKFEILKAIEKQYKLIAIYDVEYEVLKKLPFGQGLVKTEVWIPVVIGLAALVLGILAVTR
jgi:hypothetical protein